jgi:carbon storage regulator
MLVLSRKVGQKIEIGHNIEVAVLSTHRGRVKLGFAAPQGVAIRRQEIPRQTPADVSDATVGSELEHAGNQEQ